MSTMGEIPRELAEELWEKYKFRETVGYRMYKDDFLLALKEAGAAILEEGVSVLRVYFENPVELRNMGSEEILKGIRTYPLNRNCLNPEFDFNFVSKIGI